MVHPSKKKKTGGKYKGRGGKSFQSPRPRQEQGHDASPYFSLRDEAMSTERSNHFWSSETKLRSKSIAFVSAGNLVGSLPEKTRNKADKSMEEVEEQDDDEFAEDFNVDLGLEDASEEEYHQAPSVEDKGVAQSSNGIAKLTLDNVESPTRHPSPPMFFVDTNPSLPATTPKLDPPRVRNTSPTPSDSSDEVVFRGRNAPRVVTDPFASTPSTAPQSKNQSRSHSSRPEYSSTEQSLLVAVDGATTAQVVVPQGPSWDPNPKVWISRSKPGIGWSRPTSLPKKVTRVAENRRLRYEAEQEAMADYMANLQEHDAFDRSESSGPDSATHAEVEAIINLQEERMLAENGRASVPVGSYNDAEDEDSDEDEEGSDSDDESFDSDEDMEAEQEAEQRKLAGMSDEHIARLLAKQESMGLGSDELLIFDDSDGDAILGLDDIGGNFTLPQLPAAGSRGKKKKGKGHGRDSFPSASLFADVLDQDPYNGFDIMDFDRPSLRPKKKGRKFEDDTLADLDEELRATLGTTWEKDREKKRLKKAEREELRSQGLLGRGKRGRPDLSVKYENGMSLDDFRDELRQFLSSTADNLSLPPMDKHLRKGIHEIAMEFGLKSKSIGSGKSRYPKLLKTRNTIAFNDEMWIDIQANVNRGFFARLDRRGKGVSGGVSKKMTRGGGAAMAGVRYRDGEVVGAAAPEIGAENRGRAMLEKMGWSSGMALGTATNQGILQPITHTVKTSKAGLG